MSAVPSLRSLPCGDGPYFNATEAHVRNGGDWFGGPLNTDWLELS